MKAAAASDVTKTSQRSECEETGIFAPFAGGKHVVQN